jgi:hypothetical protein
MMALELEKQVRDGDPQDTGVIWQSVGEISLMGGLEGGGGRFLVQLALEDEAGWVRLCSGARHENLAQDFTTVADLFRLGLWHAMVSTRSTTWHTVTEPSQTKTWHAWMRQS